MGWSQSLKITKRACSTASQDQSYFLASVGCGALERAGFPLGALSKPQVRALAAAAGLPNAGKRSSRGICFVGKRRFTDFLGQYVDLPPGPMVDVESGRIKGEHGGLASYTLGQGARLGSERSPWFVVGKDAVRNLVYVAEGADHPALRCTAALAGDAFWVAGEPPPPLASGGALQAAGYKARYGQEPAACSVALANAAGPEAAAAGVGAAALAAGGAAAPSLLWRPALEGPDQSPSVESASSSQLLHVRFHAPARAVTPEQALVLYDGEVCLGGGLVRHPGASEFELSRAAAGLPPVAEPALLDHPASMRSASLA